MSDFKGNEKIRLEKFDNINYDFEVTVNSTECSNDGFLPYGRSLASFGVSGYQEDGLTPANDMIVDTALSGNVMTVRLKYPNAGEGRYRLEFEMILDNGMRKEADFSRIQCGDE